jgi:uncharacterized protein (DUF58 family)
VVLAIDGGRLMSQPIGGVPRVDRAVNSALLLAYVSLRVGDKAALFAFDSKPRIATGMVSGTQAYPAIQALAAGIDYSTEETNFTLSLSTLSGQLERRSLVVIFSDFADVTTAEYMIENVARLVRRHVVLFVTFRDEDLEAIGGAEPMAPEDVAQAVLAGDLARARDEVLLRLKRLGVEILDVRAAELGPQLLNRYLDIKRREVT